MLFSIAASRFKPSLSKSSRERWHDNTRNVAMLGGSQGTCGCAPMSRTTSAAFKAASSLAATAFSLRSCKSRKQGACDHQHSAFRYIPLATSHVLR